MGSARFTVEHALKMGWIKPAAPLPRAQVPSPPDLPAPAQRLAELQRELRDQRFTASGKKRRMDREGEEQVSVIEQFDLEFPHLAKRLFHVANGGKRTRLERHLMVKQGVRRGVPDLVLPVPKSGFHGLYVEMKAAKPHSAPVTDEQNDWIDFLREQGYCAEVARGGAQAMDIIRRYLDPRTPASHVGE